jgi:hypothetical protein
MSPIPNPFLKANSGDAGNTFTFLPFGYSF